MMQAFTTLRQIRGQGSITTIKLVLTVLAAFSSLQAARADLLQEPAADRKPLSGAVRLPPWLRPGHKVIYWQVLSSPERGGIGGRFEGDVINVESRDESDGSYHVIITLREDSGEEVALEFWDTRGFNQSLADYKDLVGKRISILLTHKMYSISHPQS